jgi:hypothetical protein
MPFTPACNHFFLSDLNSHRENSRQPLSSGRTRDIVGKHSSVSDRLRFTSIATNAFADHLHHITALQRLSELAQVVGSLH